jgi:O-antigen/teichoic acid export membrane protein
MDFAIGGSLPIIPMPASSTSGKRDLPTRLVIRSELLVRNTIFNLIGLGLPLLIGLLAIPPIIRQLGLERFGILSIIWVVVGYFGFVDLGLGRATTKFVAEALGKGEPEKVPGYLWTTVFFQAAMSLLGAVGLVLMTSVLTEKILKIPTALVAETRVSFYILALSLPLVLISASFRGVLEAAQRFDLVNIVKIPSSALNYLLPLGGALAGMKLPGIMILLTVARGLTLVAWAWLSFSALPVLKRRIGFHAESAKTLLVFGGWVTVSNLLAPILGSVDRLMIGALLAVGAVSYYSAPFEVVMRLGILPGSLLLTLFPMFSALNGEADLTRSKAYYARATKYLLILLSAMVILLVFFAKDAMKIWLGETFADKSTVIFQVLAVGFLVNSLAMVPFGFLQGIGRADIPAKLQIIELAFYVPLAWIMIQRMGINGAALAWTIRASADMIMLFIASEKYGKIGFRDLVRHGIGRVIALSVLFISAGAFLVRLPYGRILILGLFLGFLPATWYLAMDGNDRGWALRSVADFRKRLARSAPGVGTPDRS